MVSCTVRQNVGEIVYRRLGRRSRVVKTARRNGEWWLLVDFAAKRCVSERWQTGWGSALGLFLWVCRGHLPELTSLGTAPANSSGRSEDSALVSALTRPRGSMPEAMYSARSVDGKGAFFGGNSNQGCIRKFRAEGSQELHGEFILVAPRRRDRLSSTVKS